MNRQYLKYVWLPVVFLLVMALNATGKKDSTITDHRPALNVLSVVINVPAFRLTLYEDGNPIKSYPIAVGRLKHKTPVGRTWLIRRIEWNPWWYPPNSKWARSSKITPPGEKNPLGPVKIILGSGILVHGTPNEDSIGRPASHGCIRMHPDDARELAWTLTAYNSASMPLFNVSDADLEPDHTFKIRLDSPVKFNLVYSTVEVLDGKVFIHRDIYRKSRPGVKELEKALSDYGYELDASDRKIIKDVIKQKPPYEVELDEILSSDGEPRT